MRTQPLGTLHTLPQDGPDHFGTESPARHLVPGLRTRNDGVYRVTLIPRKEYRLTFDGVGWQLTPEGERPHAYLVDDKLQPIAELAMSHGVLALMRDRHYVIAQDDSSVWRVHEHLLAMS